MNALSNTSAFQAFIARHQRIFVLTGAGCSTVSGIPAYRDPSGAWMRRQPVTWQAFSSDAMARQRYWGRSMIGWQAFGAARPNPAHHALVRLEQHGRLSALVTQNVDGLHQAAGHKRVVDLHGRLDTVICLGCGSQSLRRRLQHRLIELNPDWLDHVAEVAPDGDADLEGVDFAAFQVPDCPRCGGLLKPDVVFFGESVPRHRITETLQWLEQSDALLVVGSSLTVYSGFRYARRATELGIPIAVLNQGRTRADPQVSLKVEDCCARVLPTIIGMV